ncbi:MAG: hypothetical protein KDD69_15850 [Bdellovibrionales bacterium]|nr:hypothetical protein [Bdellovibrionales bacterium]
MKDISVAILRRMTAEQKLRASLQLYESARSLKFAALKAKRPELTDEEIHEAVKQAFLYAKS